MPFTPIVVGLASGVVSAIVLIAALGGGAVLSVFLLIATPLPIMIAGLGWGLPAAVAGAAMGALSILGIRPAVALGHLFVVGIPAIVLTNLAYYHRASTGSEAETTDWYPTGRLLATIAFLGGAAPLAIAPMLGGSYRVLVKPIRTALDEFLKGPAGKQFGVDRLKPEELDGLAVLLADIMPVAFASYLVLIYALNFYLAGRIANASGRLMRPWPDVRALAYPAGLALALIVTIIMTFFSGLPRLIGGTFGSAVLMAFFLSGLAVLHYIADGQRPARMSVLYAIFFTGLGPFAFLIIAALGLAEPLIRLRERFPRSAPPTNT
jgi:hypothetical protein